MSAVNVGVSFDPIYCGNVHVHAVGTFVSELSGDRVVGKRLSKVSIQLTSGSHSKAEFDLKGGADELRQIAQALFDTAERCDRLTIGRENLPPLLIEHPDTGDTYYVGPLDTGKSLAHDGRYVSESEVDQPDTDDRKYAVKFFDDEALLDEAEWGYGATPDEAWRYALGAMFGPIDSEYDEEALRDMIRARQGRDGQVITCSECGGSGELTVPGSVERTRDGVYDRDTMRCDRCNGTGSVLSLPE